MRGPPQLSPSDLPCWLCLSGVVLAPLTSVLVEPYPFNDEEYRGWVYPGESHVLPVGVGFVLTIGAPVTHPMEAQLPGEWIDSVPPHVGRVFHNPSYRYSGVWLYAGGSADFDLDGDNGTDADIEAFFACLASDCPGSDFDCDGDRATDQDIAAFFRCLGGGC